MTIIDKIIFTDLLASVVFAVLAFGAVEPWSIAIFEINALALAVLLALKFVIAPAGFWKDAAAALPLFVFLIFAVCQIIPFTGRALSLDPFATGEAAIKLLALLIYFVAAIGSLRISRLRRVALITLTAFGFAVSVFAVAQRLTYNGLMYWFRPVSPYIAPFGPYGNYNHFAGMVELILPLPLAYALFAGINLEQRVVWILSVVMMAAALILSLSRGGMVTLAVQLTVLILIYRFRGDRLSKGGGESRSAGLLIAAGLAVALVLAFWIGYEPLTKRFGTLKEGAGEYSVVTRAEYWRASWRMFTDHPVFGVGLGAFPAIYPSYGSSSAKNERLEQAHNDYLQLLTDTGVIGGMIGLWFLVEIMRVAINQLSDFAGMRSRDRALIIGGYVSALGMLVHSFFDFNLQIAANALLFLFVIAMAISNGKGSASDPPSTR